MSRGRMLHPGVLCIASAANPYSCESVCIRYCQLLTAGHSKYLLQSSSLQSSKFVEPESVSVKKPARSSFLLFDSFESWYSNVIFLFCVFQYKKPPLRCSVSFSSVFKHSIRKRSNFAATFNRKLNKQPA